MGQSSIDLSKSLTSSGSGSGSGSGSNGSGSGSNNNGGTSLPLTSTERMIIAHGILCVIGFLFLLPLGALVARYFRTSTNAWFKAHQTIQSFLAGPIIIVGFSLGIASVANLGGDHFDSNHTVCCKAPLFPRAYLNRDSAVWTCTFHPLHRTTHYRQRDPLVQAQIRSPTSPTAKLLPRSFWHSHHCDGLLSGPYWV